jgi:hypothetical protein
LDLLLGSDASETLNDIVHESSAYLGYQLPYFDR